MDKVEQEEADKVDPAMEQTHKTVNMGELYDGMAVQLNQDHTDAFNDRVEAMAEEMRKD